MNFDDENETKENPDLHAIIDRELEARIVAWVLGEASAFESAELERLVREKPELAIFKRRIEAVHGLIAETARPEKQPLRLSATRRKNLLEKIGAAKQEHAHESGSVPVALDRDAREPMPTRTHDNPEGAAPSAPRKRRAAVPFRRSSKTLVLLGSAAACATLAFWGWHRFADMFSARESDMAAMPRMAEQRTTGEKIAETQRELAKKEAAERAALKNARGSQPESAGPSRYAPATEAPGNGDALAVPPVPTPLEFADLASSAPSKFKADSGGYKDANTLSGTRLATNLDDLASSITVVTNQQFQDTPASRRRGWADEFVQTEPPASKSPIMLSSPPARPWSSAESDVAGASGAVVFGQESAAMGGVQGGKARGDEDRSSSQRDESAQTETTTNSFARNLSQLDEERQARLTQKRTLDTASGRITAAQPENRDPQLSDELVALDMPATNGGTREFFGLPGVRGLAETSESTDISGAEKNDPLLSGRTVAGLPSQAEFDDARLTREKQASTAADEAEKHAKLKEEQQRRSDPSSLIIETTAAREPVSTFSLHVSDASFRIAQAALARGEKPDPARIRPEEFYNAFDYGDPAPAPGEQVACRIEQAAHPFLQQRNLVRIAVRVPATGRGAGQPLRLTVLLDTSGSMEREDRVATVRRAMQTLASLLGANDRVTLIGFARQPRLIAEELAGDRAAPQLVDLVASTPFEGGTNIEEALKLAGELARRHLTTGAQNRIVLITDGAANLGNADPARLGAMIETLRQQGIAFDACGVGTDGLDDEILEALTRKGDGRYAVLDKPEDAGTAFAQKLAGAFRPAAENVKVQVRFNPARVGAYRLVGFEQHRLREEDFRNDKVDAAELVAEEAAVAIYQIEPLPQGQGELGDVFVRFRDAATGAMVERSWTMPYDARARSFDKAGPSMQLAGVATLLAEKLRGGAVADNVRLAELAPVVGALRSHYSHDERVQDLATMFEQARRMYGE